MGSGDEFDARVEVGVSLGDGGGGVGGAVVPDGEVPVGIGLLEDAVDGEAEVVLAVINGHH